MTERFLHAPVFELGLKPPLKVRNPLPPSRSCASLHSLHNPSGAWLPDRVGAWPQVYGIGEFGFQSYMIFCRDAAQTLWPADRALQSFVRWARGAGGDGDSGSESDDG